MVGAVVLRQKTGIGLKETDPLSFNEKVSYNIFMYVLTTLQIIVN